MPDIPIPEPWKTIAIVLTAAGSGGGIYAVTVNWLNNNKTAAQKQRDGWSVEGKQIYDALQKELEAVRKGKIESDAEVQKLQEMLFTVKEGQLQLREAHQAEIAEVQRRHKLEMDKRDSELTGLKSLLRRIGVLLQQKEIVVTAEILTEIIAKTEDKPQAT